MTEIPLPTPETAHFWEGTRHGQLLLQRCMGCGHVYFPPRPFCPQCLSKEVEVFAASGRATLYSYVINHRPPSDWPPTPYSVALVTLEEGPRLVSNIVDVAQTPEALQLCMPLEVTFKRVSEEIWLPVFRPAEKRRA